MKRFAVAATVGLAMVASGRAHAQGASLIGSTYGLDVCHGAYALCAASTCTPTGRMIDVNVAGGGTASFPEAACTCPVFNGPAIADPHGGNMQGSCARPGPNQVWSLYWPKSHIPQAANDWSRQPASSEVEFQICDGDVGASFANCFSFACTLDKKRKNGVRTATCFCPLGENPDGSPVPADTAVITPAGQCNPDACDEHPVGIGAPQENGQPSQCLGTLSSQ